MAPPPDPGSDEDVSDFDDDDVPPPLPETEPPGQDTQVKQVLADYESQEQEPEWVFPVFLAHFLPTVFAKDIHAEFSIVSFVLLFVYSTCILARAFNSKTRAIAGVFKCNANCLVTCSCTEGLFFDHNIWLWQISLCSLVIDKLHCILFH